ncbi:hypothetical protein SAMN04515666_103608 [Bosea lupini]|uniref:Uncharacterized protein n=1 Tax=Bosea lupini TaxID=1036779 RepID=A0A1H7PUY3_9HYPH|nr:hypothetical protein [Bosea lupini]SEL39204.1 hypothetical protein SAMN04515666_103608 [Bosea lupini]
MRFISLVIALTVFGPAVACDTNDIEIQQSSWRVDGEYTRVVGEFKNGCTEPTGAQLQLVFRRKSGEIVHVKDFWPASTNNVKAGALHAFGTMDRLAGLSFDQVDVKVIAVKRW